MKIAIYSRKSKFTGKGDSIKNQIDLCKEYCTTRFENTSIVIYEDEGFSGGNINRPQFQLMLKDAKQHKFECVICYRLDRISRNVADFSSTLEELNENGIAFISISEQFDTSTPMGRAMMYIASVFAQLERETIAERIRDNMMQLAKTGRWLGGITPTGFKSEPIIFNDSSSKERKMFKLTPRDDELEIINILFNKYVELKSLTKVEQFCEINDIKTKNNVTFKRYTIKNILSNPVYSVADKFLYDYLTENSYEVYCDESEFNGKNGVMAYNKTEQNKKKTSRSRDKSEWIIAIGMHKGIISSETWIKVQKLLMQNKDKSFRKVKSSDSLLSGLLKCSNCDSYMRPKAGRINKNGEIPFYYMCELKERSKRSKCTIKNVKGNNLDKIIIQKLLEFSTPGSVFISASQNDKIHVKNSQDNITEEISLIKNKIKATEQIISNLVSTLGEGKDSSAAKYIIAQIEDLDKQTAKLKERLLVLRQKEEVNKIKEDSLDIMSEMISNFSQNADRLSVEKKRMYLRSIIEKVVWDGTNIEIQIFGVNTEKK